MYRLHNTSEHGSGVTNMYSISNAASRAATPMQMGGGGDQLVMLSGKYYKNTISIKEGTVSSIQYLPYDAEIKINEELEKQLKSFGVIIGMEVCDYSGNRTKLPIDQVEDEILARVKDNITFCLGHAVKTNRIKDAMEKK